MKDKLVIIIGMAVLIGTIISAVTLTSKLEAISYVQEQKLVADVSADDIILTITSDKICRLDYETELPEYCEACYEAIYEGQTYSRCVGLEPDTTLAMDKATMETDAKQVIQQIINNANKQDVQYIEREMTGTNWHYEAQQIEP